MKKLLLLLALAPLFKAPAQTSVYHQFPDSNAVWNYKMQAFCMFGGFVDVDYSFTITGDTLINSQVYHKLHTPFIQINSIGNCTYVPPTGYRGGMREDTMAHKLYYVAPAQNTEQLYFDFNWQVGDTITGMLATFMPIPDTVVSIDSVLVGTSFRKRWNISPWYNIYVIEGIGSTYGLLEVSPSNTPDFPDYSLLCFSQNNQALYPASNPSCILITGTATLANEKPEITVFPNPNAGAFSVDLRKARTINRAAMYDLNGKIIHEQTVNGKTILQFENPENGIYMLVLEDESGNRYTYKVSSCR